MEQKSFYRFLKNNKGQSTVEYILLLIVVVSLTLTVYRSQLFQDFLGEDSELFNIASRQMSYAYRYGNSEVRPTDTDFNDYGNLQGHQSYYKSGTSRFFSVRDGYPQ